MTETVSKELVERLMANRPFKLSAEEVDYRETEDEDAICGNCIHFFKRVVDGLTTCEIFRNEETDEKGVDPSKTCDFHEGISDEGNKS